MGRRKNSDILMAIINGASNEEVFELVTMVHPVIERKAFNRNVFHLCGEYGLYGRLIVSNKTITKKNTNVCVEIYNLAGGYDAAHKRSIADFVAYHIDGCFIIIPKRVLRTCAAAYAKGKDINNPTRRTRFNIPLNIGKFLGSTNKKDVYMYVPMKDILKYQDEITLIKY